MEGSDKEWNTGCLKFIGILFIIATILFICITDFKQTRANRSNCDQVGGDYQVVGQEMLGKTTIDIYGCVK